MVSFARALRLTAMGRGPVQDPRQRQGGATLAVEARNQLQPGAAADSLYGIQQPAAAHAPTVEQIRQFAPVSCVVTNCHRERRVFVMPA